MESSYNVCRPVRGEIENVVRKTQLKPRGTFAEKLASLPLELQELIYKESITSNPTWMEDIRRLKGRCDGRWLSRDELARSRLFLDRFFGEDITYNAVKTVYEQAECVFSDGTIPLHELHAFVSCKTLPGRVVPKFHIRKVRILINSVSLFNVRWRLQKRRNLNILPEIGDPCAFDRKNPTPLAVTFAFNTEEDSTGYLGNYVDRYGLIQFLEDSNVHFTLERLHLRGNTTVLFEYLHLRRYQQEPTVISWATLREFTKEERFNAFTFTQIVARAEWEHL